MLDPSHRPKKVLYSSSITKQNKIEYTKCNIYAYSGKKILINYLKPFIYKTCGKTEKHDLIL